MLMILFEKHKRMNKKKDTEASTERHTNKYETKSRAEI